MSNIISNLSERSSSITMNLKKGKWSDWFLAFDESETEVYSNRFAVQDVLVKKPSDIIINDQEICGQIGFSSTGELSWRQDNYRTFVICNGEMILQNLIPFKKRMFQTPMPAQLSGTKVWIRLIASKKNCEVKTEVKIVPMKNKSWKEKYNQGEI